MSKTRKELLKGPDEFITFTGKIIQWSRKNKKALLIGVVAFFVLIGATSFYRISSSQRETAGAVLLSRNLSSYPEVRAREDEHPDRVLEAVKPDFEKLIDEYGSQPAGQAGRLILAHAALSGRSPDEAIALYSRALSDFRSDPTLGNVLRNGLASAHMQKGDHAAAIEQFKAVTAGKSALMKDAALFHLGYLYSATGEAEKSRQAYRQLRAEFPGSMYAEIAREKAGEGDEGSKLKNES
jgi:predicted negative regulator of RcsB-dependent stress response